MCSILPKTVREEAHEIMAACPKNHGDTKCLEGIRAFVDVGLMRKTKKPFDWYEEDRRSETKALSPYNVKS